MQDQEISKYIIKKIGGLRAETIPETGFAPQHEDDSDCCGNDCNCSSLFDSDDHPKSQPYIQD
jgi:hypothetical protein